MILESRCTSKCGAPCLRTLKSKCLYALGLCRIKSIRRIYNPKKKKHPINLTVINDICMYYEAPNMIELEIFILLAFPLKRRERKKKYQEITFDVLISNCFATLLSKPTNQKINCTV